MHRKVLKHYYSRKINDSKRPLYFITLQDEPCRFRVADVGATDTGYTDVTKGSEDDLKSAVATVGPISVAIDASHSSFQVNHEIGLFLLYPKIQISSQKHLYTTIR